MSSTSSLSVTELNRLDALYGDNKIRRSTYLKALKHLKDGTISDGSALLAAAEKGQLTAANLGTFVAAAVDAGKSVRLSSQDEAETRSVTHHWAKNGDAVRVITTRNVAVKTSVKTVNLGPLTALPPDTASAHTTRAFGAAGDGFALNQVDLTGPDDDHARFFRLVTPAGTRQVVDTPTGTVTEIRRSKRRLRGRKGKAPATSKASAKGKAPVMCKYGAACHGRNGGCPYTHPPRNPRAPPCRYGDKCRRFAAGTCTFDHVSDDSPALVAARKQFLDGTHDLEQQGVPNPVEVWGSAHPNEFAMLVESGDIGPSAGPAPPAAAAAGPAPPVADSPAADPGWAAGANCTIC